MRFRLQILLGNDAMKTGADVRAKLADLAKDERGPIAFAELGDQGLIRDDNGNTVGFWKVTK